MTERSPLPPEGDDSQSGNLMENQAELPQSPPLTAGASSATPSPSWQPAGIGTEDLSKASEAGNTGNPPEDQASTGRAGSRSVASQDAQAPPVRVGQAVMERCPICRATLNGADTCRRCRAELGSVIRVE